MPKLPGLAKLIGLMRILYFLGGLFSVGLGVLGAFLPVMPSTCFFILAAYFFSKSSARLESWVLEHPRFGPSVKAWRMHRAMSRPAKVAAFSGMSFGQVMLLAAWPADWIVLSGSIFIVGSAIYIYRRPLYRDASILQVPKS